MSSRTLAALATPALVALALVAGAPSAAAADHKPSRSAAASSGQGVTAADRETQRHHHCATARRCRPNPLPKPAGGWPCAKDHSCSTKHHYPVCPPTKPHPKPPVVHPRPPVASPPATPAGHHGTPRLTADTPASPQLAITGASDYFVYGYTGLGLGLIGLGGGLLRRFSQVGDEIRGVLR